MSARDVQLPETQFYKGKSYRTFGPVGPYLTLVSADEFRRFTELRLELRGLAVRYPLRVLSTILGVPRQLEPRILELTSRLLAPDDGELGQGSEEGAFRELLREFAEMFLPIIEDRRARPTAGLASFMANARLEGELLGLQLTDRAPE